MKYAAEVIGLMSVYPGRRFKVRQIVNHAAPGSTPKQRMSIREGIRRVLLSLEDSGQVASTRAEVPNGANAEYWWKPQHEVLANRNANRDNFGRALAP